MRYRVMTLLLAALLAVAALNVGCCRQCAQTEDNKALVQRFTDGYNTKADIATLDKFLAADYARHCQATEPTEMRGIEEFARFIAEDRASFPDAHMTVDQLVAEGDRVAFFARWVGTQEGAMGPFPATGKQATADIAGVHRIENGKIAETWCTWDNLAILKQLGHTASPSPEPVEEP